MTQLEDEELRRRLWLFLYYFLRQPVYDLYTRSKLQSLCDKLGKIPVLGIFGGKILMREIVIETHRNTNEQASFANTFPCGSKFISTLQHHDQNNSGNRSFKEEIKPESLFDSYLKNCSMLILALSYFFLLVVAGTGLKSTGANLLISKHFKEEYIVQGRNLSVTLKLHNVGNRFVSSVCDRLRQLNFSVLLTTWMFTIKAFNNFNLLADRFVQSLTRFPCKRTVRL